MDESQSLLSHAIGDKGEISKGRGSGPYVALSKLAQNLTHSRYL